jgi:ribosome recycling factor
MSYDFKTFEQKLKDIEGWLVKEYATLRTGRATVTILDRVFVDSYGARTPLNQVANIGSEDPKTLRIAPWDSSQIATIEKAIALADLGVSTVSDGKGVRVIFPELTSERRELLVRQAGKKLEEAKVSIRNARDEVKNEINDAEKDGGMGKDEKFTYMEDMQKIVDACQNKLENLLAEKEKEIKL